MHHEPLTAGSNGEHRARADDSDAGEGNDGEIVVARTRGRKLTTRATFRDPKTAAPLSNGRRDGG